MADQAYTPTPPRSQTEPTFHSDNLTNRNVTHSLIRLQPAPQAVEQPIQLSILDPVEIPLTKGYVAIVDPVDADLLDLNWYAMESQSGRAYAQRYDYAFKPRRRIWMHRVILSRMIGREPREGEEVDHINGHGIDNRRCNLRLSSHQQNMCNTKKQSNNKSGYKGVSWHKRSQKWTAQIHIDRKVTYLGVFDTPEEAHRIYVEAARKHYGEFFREE